MSILAANLKLYSPFQKQSFLYKVYLFLEVFLVVGFTGAMTEMTHGEKLPLSILALPFVFLFLFGQIVAMVQIDVLSMPFSLCLPGHNNVPRRTIFIIGLMAAVSAAIISTVFPQESGHMLMMLFMAAMVLTLYFLAVCLSFYFSKTQNRLFINGALFTFIPVLLVFFFQKDLLTTDSNAMLYCIIALLVSGTSLSIVAWDLLGYSSLKRKCFGRPSKLSITLDRDLIDQLHAKSNYYFHETPERKNSNSKFALKFFKSFTGSRFFSFKHSLMGMLYCLFSRHFTLNGNEPVLKLILASSFIFFSGYFENENLLTYEKMMINPFSLLAAMPLCMMLSSFFMPQSHNMLLPASRSRQFWVSFLLWFIKSITVMILASIVIVVSWLLQVFMPEVELFGFTFIYSSPGLHTIFWTLIMLPIIDFMLGYVSMPFRLFSMIFITSILFILSFISFAANNIYIHAFLLTLMILMTNGLFFSLFSRYWFRKDITLLS